MFSVTSSPSYKLNFFGNVILLQIYERVPYHSIV